MQDCVLVNKVVLAEEPMGIFTMSTAFNTYIQYQFGKKKKYS